MSKDFKPELGEVYISNSMYGGEALASSYCIDYLEHKGKAKKRTLEAVCNGLGWDIGDYSSFEGQRFNISFDQVTALRKLLEHLESLIE
jgi:hypothetical protein